ncbi:Uncharacterized protein HZ326_22385 [Fusarium oxysporum f. sp. albedinis]|nr:Uncharacterized protein HZ326_22385 [Fusarium oxysporum f. sp. albedinis]
MIEDANNLNSPSSWLKSPINRSLRHRCPRLQVDACGFRGLGLTIDEGHVFLVEVGKDLSRTIMNGYWNTHDYPSPATNHSPVTLTF